MGLGGFEKSIRWITLVFALVAFVVVPFLLLGTATESAALRFFARNENAWLVALVVTGLLSLDVLLPVPSSIVSTMAGGFLGLTAGTAASFVGMTASCVVGWWFGAKVGGTAVDFVLGKPEGDRLRRFFDRYGLFAIIVCRPVPVAAEASIILAGASGAAFGALFGGVALANLGIALGYAAVGAFAWTTDSFLIAFAGAIALPTAAAIGYRMIVSRMIGR
jgi:membrane protein DedA with SNARE-associated domain